MKLRGGMLLALIVAGLAIFPVRAEAQALVDSGDPQRRYSCVSDAARRYVYSPDAKNEAPQLSL